MNKIKKREHINKERMIYDYEILLYNGLFFSSLRNAVQKMEGSAQVTQDNGEITTAKVILKDNKIQEVSIDETVADVDKTKKQLQNSYGMKQASSIGKEWYEQVLFFEDYVKNAWNRKY